MTDSLQDSDHTKQSKESGAAMIRASTLRKIGPRDHGREMSLDDFMAADYQGGNQYELIDGRLYVSPQADLPQNVVELWIFGRLYLYSLRHPTIINYVSPKARVFVPGRRKVTNPEPDVACYRDFPLDVPFTEIRWEDVWPILVVEILSANDADKDLVRNVELYLQVPSIMEYWLVDTRKNPSRPTLLI
jgi:Uma2 family endonuclease